ncbi:hypothetical protein AS850_08120 [Frondihabitans sp. 762G35]|nr:hypothetical protein AS850_08120 [Frondihabitans sp. 762G35]
MSALVATAVLVLIAADRTFPVFFGDEIGYLANSLSISGGHDLGISADSYYPGWSLLLAPLWWITSDPLAVYRVAVILAMLSAIAMIPVLTLLGRRLGLGAAPAVVAASAATLLPGHALMAGFALAESFLGLVVAGSVLLAVVAAQTGSSRVFAAFGATTGLAFVVHGRVVALVVAAGVWGLLLLLRRRPRAGIALLASTALVAGSGYLLYRHLDLTLYRSAGRESDGIGKLFGSAPGAVALAGSGQFWFAVVSTAGLVLPGILLIARAVAREWRTRRSGWATWFALGAAGLVVVSVTYVSGAVATAERLDVYVYGRYLEPITDVVAFLGLVLLARHVPRRVAAVVGAVFAVTALAYGLVAAALVPTARGTVHGWNPMTVFGLAAFDWSGPPGDASLPLLAAGVVGGVVFAALLVLRLARRNAVWMLVVAVAAFAAGSVTGEFRTVLPSYEQYRTAFTLADVARALPGESVSYDTAPDPVRGIASGAISQNAYQFLLAPEVVPVIDSRKTLPTTVLSIGRQFWPAGEAEGWKRLAVDSRYDNGLWVRPGALQDRLDREGRLTSE